MMVEMEKIVSIPEGKAGRVLGKGGNVKKKIEKNLKVKISVSDGTVSVKGESLDVLKASDIVKAIGLGFPKMEAFDLFRKRSQLAIFDVSEVVPESQMRRVFGRIIGEKGKTKHIFEKKLNVNMMITDEVVAAIGSPKNLRILREALDKLVRGASHSSVYRHIDRKRSIVENL